MRDALGAVVPACAAALALATAAPASAPPSSRSRCSTQPQLAARYIVPPPPFVARIVSVARRPLPAFEPTGGGPGHKRLYAVTFYAVKGNAVLPTGHRYTQFAYVKRTSASGRWCFLKGGSGP